MNFFQKTTGSKPTAKNRYWSSDLLENEGIKLFYYAREGLRAYLCGTELLKKREIALQVEKTLELFLSYSYSKEEIDFLIELLQRKNKEKSKIENPDQSAYKILQDLSPAGIKLLEVPKNINIQILKRLYRRASLIYHPDRGGTHEKMLQVNETFNLFYNTLIDAMTLLGNKDQSSEALRSSSESWDDWLYSVYLTLAGINGDYFAIDKALYYLKLAYQHALKSSSKYIGYFARNLYEEGVLCSPCGALARFKMKEELIEALAITSYLIDRIPEGGDSYGSVILYSEKKFMKQLGTKLVLNHPEKAKNAYRLGKIDKKRFEQVMSKFNQRVFNEEEVISKINDFLTETEVINKLSSSDYKVEASNPQIIAYPSLLQERFDHLDDDQKWEYLKTWGAGGNGKLVMKYYEIRTQEIMLGLIYNHDSINHALLEKEIAFFCDNFGERFQKYIVVSDFAKYLKSLNNDARKERLFLLKSLDDPEPRSPGLMIILSFSEADQSYKKRISVDDDYVGFAKMELNEIKKYQATGRCSSDYQLAWNRDVSALAEFNKSAIGKTNEWYWLYEYSSPEKVIASCKPYVEGLLDLGRRFHPNNVHMLSIGYDINRLTIAYGKLRQWEQVIYWGDLFFSLPIEYRRYDDGSEIRKRLDRAKKIISKMG